MVGFGIAARLSHIQVERVRAPKARLSPPQRLGSVQNFRPDHGTAKLGSRRRAHVQRPLLSAKDGALLRISLPQMLGMLGAAFGVIVFLAVVVWQMIKVFKQIRPLAAYLNYPYLLWLCYAGFLNFVFLYAQGAVVEF